MSENKETDKQPSGKTSSHPEGLGDSKSGTSETYDMKDFCPGIRIEAKDFDGKWYPAKVSDVDWTENEILVHFENWNTKFDEWIPMDSSRLRPIQKPVVPKDIVKFSKGEEVMAVWSSNQKYPGVIQSVLANDRYDVLFSDGFLKRLKSHKISKLQEGNVKSEVKNFADIGTKEERRERKRKINVAELFHINKRPRKKGLVHSKSQDIKTYPVSKSHTKSSAVKKLLTSEESKDDTNVVDSNSSKEPEEKVVTPKASLPTKGLIDSIPAAFEVKYLTGETELWSKQLYQRSEGRTAGKVDIVILNPQGRKFRSRNEIMKYCEENGIIYKHDSFDFSAKGRPKSKPVVQNQPAKILANLDDKDKYMKKGTRKSQDLPIGSQTLEVPHPTGDFLSQENVPNKVFIGDYEVVIENGKFICPVKICSKHFRRENLLHMHMKHYHPEFSKYLDYTPSVTDLAYARTVGNLDAAEVTSPAPRKQGSMEKPDKLSVKTDNIKKLVDTSNESPKEGKKSKTSDVKNEVKAQLVKTSTENSTIPPVSTTTVEELLEENSQKNKFMTNSLFPEKLASNSTEKEHVLEERIPSFDNSATEKSTVDSFGTTSSHVVKSSKHHRLHSRKKASRFQGSFADHIKKKRLLSQDRSKPHHQQPQSQLKQQSNQVQPSQTTISTQSLVEDLNSNLTNQTYLMARYPRTHVNMTNEKSGKNNLLTNCKTLSPVTSWEKKVEKTDKDENRNGDLREVLGSDIHSKEASEKKNFEVKNESACSRRSYLAGLLSAKKRKRKVVRKRLKMKKSNLKDSNLLLEENGSGQNEFNKKPDDSGIEKSNFDFAIIGSKIQINKKPVSKDGDLSHSEIFTRKLKNRSNLSSSVCKKSIKVTLPRLNIDSTELIHTKFREAAASDEPLEESKDLSNSNSELRTDYSTSSTENDSKINSNQSVETEKKSENKVAKGSNVLLENVYRKENNLKSTKVPQKWDDENSSCKDHHVKEANSAFYSQAKGKKKKKSKKSSRSRDRKRVLKKKVRFENSITEKWINVDGRENVINDEKNVRTGNEEKKQKMCTKEDVHQQVADKSVSNNKTCSLEILENPEESKSPLVTENDKIEKLRRNEIINCLCGVTEEDGLMIQCDLCLCWQHGYCANIVREVDVPDKYTCHICKNPYRARLSTKYIHDQEWLKEGTLPSLSFRSKREDLINQRKTILKRSHDLSGSITLLSQVIHSLRLKVNIAEKKDHPKLWLWAKKWTEKKPNRLKEESEVALNQDQKQLPKAPEPEAPIDSAECRLNLLDHLIHYQTLVDDRLSCIESLVAELESMQDDAVNDETPDRYPRTKATVQMILRDLNTMKKIALI